jgi:hypothetical protein
MAKKSGCGMRKEECGGQGTESGECYDSVTNRVFSCWLARLGEESRRSHVTEHCLYLSPASVPPPRDYSEGVREQAARQVRWSSTEAVRSKV